MADNRKDEARALSREERDLAVMARYPALGRIKEAELAELIVRLRERRDRARQIANRQRREIRGKTAPAGASHATADAGSHSKAHYLGCALRRAQDEVRRRSGEQPQTPAAENQVGES